MCYLFYIVSEPNESLHALKSSQTNFYTSFRLYRGIVLIDSNFKMFYFCNIKEYDFLYKRRYLLGILGIEFRRVNTYSKKVVCPQVSCF